MNGPPDTTMYPPPDPERVERALHAMHARRLKLRRLRILYTSTAFVVIAAVTAAALVTTNSGHHVQVVSTSSTTTSTTTTTATTTTTTRQPTTTTSTTSTTTGTLPATQQITYQPFTATGAIDPSLRVTSSVTGTCLTGESSRSYRCFGNPPGGIYDPCFAGPHGTSQPLVCPHNPATPDVVKFSATTVNSSPPITSTRPWAIQLSGGQVCVFVSAAWGGLGPYGCQSVNASTTPADCRQPQPSQPWWTADCQDQQTDASPFTPIRVNRIWF